MHEKLFLFFQGSKACHVVVFNETFFRLKKNTYILIGKKCQRKRMESSQINIKC